jgi:two-component system cell cycle sensor histidine kinase/response regulator CckA
LATCYGIVKQGNGHIWVYSEPGNGTTIKIYLPRIQDAVDTTALSSAVASPGGHETILLVEDEPVVCQFAVQALRAQGYQVLEASNGEEALQIAQEYEGEIHLLLTDVVMPKMSGKVLATHLQTLRPNTKILYVSGYTDNTIVHHGVLEERVAFLQKPYTLSALSQKVREVLDTNS